MIPAIDEGTIIEFIVPETGKLYDGVVWRVVKESPESTTLIVRYVDRIPDPRKGGLA